MAPKKKAPSSSSGSSSSSSNNQMLSSGITKKKSSKNKQNFPLAQDAYARRFQGTSLVQTELPRVLQTKVKSEYSFRFKAIFATRHHLYGFYYPSVLPAMRLARLCKFSQTWERVGRFELLMHENALQFVLPPIPWSPNEVFLFVHNRLRVLNLETMSLGEDIDLSSMLSFPEDMVINVELRLFVNWRAAAFDEATNSLYAQAEVSLGAQNLMKDLGIFRLDWATKRWSRLQLVETPTRKLKEGAFLAVNDGKLYVGVTESTLHRDMTFQPLIRDFDEVHSLMQVICINLETLGWDYQQIAGTPPRSILQKQVNIQFSQYGETVYCLNALATGELMRVVKNQLWALDLPSLTLSQVNDGPCGRIQVRLPLERGRDKKGAQAGKDGKCSNTSKTKKESVCKTCGLLHQRGGLLASASVANFAASFFPGGRRLSRALSIAYGLAVEPSNGPSPMTVPASSQLMRHYRFTVSPEDGELWAMVNERFYLHKTAFASNRKLTMYRIPVKEKAFPTLASLTLDMVLLRRPMAGLVAPHEARSRSAHLRRYTKQERTVEHLRAALRSSHLLTHLNRYLPPEEDPNKALVPLPAPVPSAADHVAANHVEAFQVVGGPDVDMIGDAEEEAGHLVYLRGDEDDFDEEEMYDDDEDDVIAIPGPANPNWFPNYRQAYQNNGFLIGEVNGDYDGGGEDIYD